VEAHFKTWDITMREILYKNLTGIDNKKRDLCIREVVAKDGVLATIERRCIYFVRDRIHIKDPSNLDELRRLKKTENVWKKKHFHILRRHDSSTGEDKLICKVAGTFYAIAGHYVFCIAFVHSFKVDLEVLAVGGKKA
jgi:hypothetical protein